MSARLPILRPLLLVLALPLGALTCTGALAPGSRTDANAPPPARVASPASAPGLAGTGPERDPGAPRQAREPAPRRSR